MSELDYYELLDVTPTASTAEIKEAYRRAVRTAHPDVGGTSGMFRLLTLAYETLSDPRRRADYDARPGNEGFSVGDARGRDADFQEPPFGEAETPDAAWGDETTWRAEEGRPNPVADSVDPDAWIYGRRGLIVFMVVWSALAAIFAAGVILLLYAPAAVHPAAAGDDLFASYSDQPIVRIVTLLVYVFLLWIARSESARGLLIAHVIFVICLIAWPVAYWDLAASEERWSYVVGAILWLVYNGLLVGVSVFMDARDDLRRYEDSLDSRQPRELTLWARTEAGALTLRIGYVVTAALFLFLAYVFVFGHGLIRPAAAGPDGLDVALRYPVAVAVVVGIYGYLAYGSIGIEPGGLDLLHVPVAIGLLCWPLAYWDIATTEERWTFGVVAFLWVAYLAALYATSSLVDRRRPEPEWSR